MFKTKNVLQDDIREYCAFTAAWLEDLKGCREIFFVSIVIDQFTKVLHLSKCNISCENVDRTPVVFS